MSEVVRWVVSRENCSIGSGFFRQRTVASLKRILHGNFCVFLDAIVTEPPQRLVTQKSQWAEKVASQMYNYVVVV